MRCSLEGSSSHLAAAFIAAAATCLYLNTVPHAIGPDDLWVPNSPDAAAVQAIAMSFSETGKLSLATAGPWPASMQRARSLAVHGDRLVPGTFAGLPLLYGALAKVFRLDALMWLTPLLGGLGVLLLYAVVQRRWGGRVGLISSMVLAVCPAYWYVATQPYTPTLPFIILAGASVGLLSRPLLGNWTSFFGGLCAAAALAIRPNEALWLVPLLLLVALARRAPLRSILYALAGVALPIVAVAYWHGATFGSPLATGYGAAVAGSGLYSFDAKVLLRTIWFYIIQLHWWLVGLFVASKVYLWVQRRGQTWWPWYLAGSTIIFVALTFTYASWNITDSPGIAEPTIGNSQVRYMLPLFISMALPVGLLLSRWKSWLVACLLLLWAGWGVHLVMFSPGDGTVAVQRTLNDKLASLEIIARRTDMATLVVAGRNDKVILGHRPTTNAPNSDDWAAIAAGMGTGWPAATYLPTDDLPEEAIAAGIHRSEQISLPDGHVLSLLEKI